MFAYFMHVNEINSKQNKNKQQLGKQKQNAKRKTNEHTKKDKKRSKVEALIIFCNF